MIIANMGISKSNRNANEEPVWTTAAVTRPEKARVANIINPPVKVEKIFPKYCI
jgi:hypothetical protein